MLFSHLVPGARPGCEFSNDYMAQQNSFDIVSKVDRAEITNAINQTAKEVGQRFDFKGSHANVALE